MLKNKSKVLLDVFIFGQYLSENQHKEGRRRRGKAWGR